MASVCCSIEQVSGCAYVECIEQAIPYLYMECMFWYKQAIQHPSIKCMLSYTTGPSVSTYHPCFASPMFCGIKYARFMLLYKTDHLIPHVKCVYVCLGMAGARTDTTQQTNICLGIHCRNVWLLLNLQRTTDTQILWALQQVSGQAVHSKQTHFVGARQLGEITFQWYWFQCSPNINSNVFDFYFLIWSLSWLLHCVVSCSNVAVDFWPSVVLKTLHSISMLLVWYKIELHFKIWS
jgi:hypothetical protein